MILSKRPEIERFLSHPDSPVAGDRVCAALIWGRDRSGVRERADALARAIVERPDDPFDVALLTDGDLDSDGGRLGDELNALSMLGGRRLVRLRLNSEKIALDRLTAEAVSTHVQGGFNPDAFLLMEAGALERGSALRKAVEQAKRGAVSIPVYEDEVGDIARIVRQALAAERVGLTPEALDLLVARLPKERGVARQEIERLVMYLGPGSGVASAADLEPFLGVEPEASFSQAAADAFGGRAGDALAAVRRARGEGEGGVAAVRALSLHLGRLRRAGILVSGGGGPQDAAKASGVFWKQERGFLRQLQAWRTDDLEAITRDILDADLACKSASAPDGLIAERAYLTIAMRARRIGL